MRRRILTARFLTPGLVTFPWPSARIQNRVKARGNAKYPVVLTNMSELLKKRDTFREILGIREFKPGDIGGFR